MNSNFMGTLVRRAVFIKNDLKYSVSHDLNPMKLKLLLTCRSLFCLWICTIISVYSSEALGQYTVAKPDARSDTGPKNLRERMAGAMQLADSANIVLDRQSPVFALPLELHLATALIGNWVANLQCPGGTPRYASVTATPVEGKEGSLLEIDVQWFIEKDEQYVDVDGGWSRLVNVNYGRPVYDYGAVFPTQHQHIPINMSPASLLQDARYNRFIRFPLRVERLDNGLLVKSARTDCGDVVFKRTDAFVRRGELVQRAANTIKIETSNLLAPLSRLLGVQASDISFLPEIHTRMRSENGEQQGTIGLQDWFMVPYCVRSLTDCRGTKNVMRNAVLFEARKGRMLVLHYSKSKKWVCLINSSSKACQPREEFAAASRPLAGYERDWSSRTRLIDQAYKIATGLDVSEPPSSLDFAMFFISALVSSRSQSGNEGCGNNCDQVLSDQLRRTNAYQWANEKSGRSPDDYKGN
jgi:hypothetical protein